jgi:hypothetical protein
MPARRVISTAVVGQSGALVMSKGMDRKKETKKKPKKTKAEKKAAKKAKA